MILTADESFASCGMASTFLLSGTSPNGELRHYHPCPVELVGGCWSLAVVLEFLFTDHTAFLSSTAVDFLSQSVRCLVVSTPVAPFFFRTFQTVVLAMSSASIRSSLFSQLQDGLFFSHRQVCGRHVGAFFLTTHAKPWA